MPDFIEPQELYKELIGSIKKYHPSTDITQVEKAYQIAAAAHKDQKRKSGEAYIIHPLCVSMILAELELDKETIVAGLLHDVVEDTIMTDEEIAQEFGAEVALLVDGVTKVVLDTKSLQYQNAADWVGVLFAVQAIGSVLWAICIPMFKDRRRVYSLSLVLGGIGFISTYFMHDPYMLFISFLLIGCAWAAMLALPFTILTNSISGKNMGTYLGLFNGTICVPQICAAALGGLILPLLGGHQVNMLVLGGVLLVAGALSVGLVKETYAEKEN